MSTNGSQRFEPTTAQAASIWPIGFAGGAALMVIGLVLSPLIVAPLGAAIAVASGIAWARGLYAAETLAAEEPEIEPRAEERYPRNSFLAWATMGIGGLVVAGIAVPVAGFAALPSLLGQRRRPVDLGPIDAFPEGRFVIASFLSDPEAGEVSRRAAYIRNNGLVGGVPSFTAMSSRCTHVGCPTQPNGPVFNTQHRTERTPSGAVGLVPTLPAGGFGCPCHGSQFDEEGNRTAGPAARALDRYEFSIRRGHLWLDRLYSVSHVDGSGGAARIHRIALRGAGEPATGPESWLYPIHPAN
jgi:Rieske Fe-S protein